jgi:putative transposase
MGQRPRPTGVVADEYLVSDAFWAKVQPLIPPEKPKKKRGRPRMEDRAAFQGIYYVLRTGIQWHALPRGLGKASTVYDRFREWKEAGLFEALWLASLLEFDRRVGLDLMWQSADGVMTKAPLGGEKNGAQSDGPGQAWNEAERARRRSRITHRNRRGSRQRE